MADAIVARSSTLAIFPVVLIGASILPYGLMPLLAAGATPGVEQTRQAILFLGQVHIALTALLYFDAGFAPIVAAHRWRYYWCALGAAIAFGLSFMLLPVQLEFLWWWTYVGWQNWHFGRQNLGVVAMVGAAEGSGSLRGGERLAILIANLSGIVGLTELSERPDHAFQQSFPLLWHALELGAWVAIAGFIGAAVIAAIALARREGGFYRAAALIFSVGFFCPAIFAGSIFAGFTAVSMSHSLQYIVFMAAFWFNAPRRQPLPAFGLFAAVALIGGAVLTIRGEFGPMVGAVLHSEASSRFVFGFMFGLVVAHFVVDAHAWRLRERPQRALMRERFDFVFGRGAV